ncbi:hypothetical protein QTP70_034562 [Hemibagrus guttatus]|uniref:Uncharacterized protein n=1 Tax=Hemibagrus guttatus TaxID=175788 RepID=A0AAE0VB28_9TELE|nr:hypothetical protein QTP70_034562 [Hemibagrus guttatus]
MAEAAKNSHYIKENKFGLGRPYLTVPSHGLPGASSFYAKPLVHLDFPSFGESAETADVLNFLEQCDNFLDIWPLPNAELLGTLSTVLRGPALSWWKAERAKTRRPSRRPLCQHFS